MKEGCQEFFLHDCAPFWPTRKLGKEASGQASAWAELLFVF